MIADRAELEVDVRVATMAEGERITALHPRVAAPGRGQSAYRDRET